MDAVTMSKHSLPGRLFITTHALCFFSSYYGEEKKVKLPFNNVNTFSKAKLGMFHYGINVRTLDEQEFMFRKLSDTDTVLSKLSRCIDAFRLDNGIVPGSGGNGQVDISTENRPLPPAP